LYTLTTGLDQSQRLRKLMQENFRVIQSQILDERPAQTGLALTQSVLESIQRLAREQKSFHIEGIGREA